MSSNKSVTFKTSHLVGPSGLPNIIASDESRTRLNVIQSCCSSAVFTVTVLAWIVVFGVRADTVIEAVGCKTENS